MKNPLHELQQLGQSIWYDNIRRAFIDSGQLADYRERYAVTGVTSNPTIFERAISGSDDYDDMLAKAIDEGLEEHEEVFWRLAVRDVADAADVLREVYDDTGGGDGLVSLELPPRLSRDTEGAIELATELFRRLDRPNVMIKVVGTSEGVGAIEELTYRGINVNVTLLFSLDQWEAVAEAYVRGLERRLEEGQDLDVVSVASFFISRIDLKANEQLPQRLRNRLGVANGHVVYAAYRRWLASDRWQRLAEAGARPQRLLWASTSTKDPNLSETFYVTELAAPDRQHDDPANVDRLRRRRRGRRAAVT